MRRLPLLLSIAITGSLPLVAGARAPARSTAGAALCRVRWEPGAQLSEARLRRLRVPVRTWSLRLPKRRLLDAQLGPVGAGRQALFVTSDEEPDVTGIVCFDPASGRPRWSRSAGQIRAAAADERCLYVLSTKGQNQGFVRAFRWEDGRPAWRRSANWLGGSEMVADGRFVVWSEGERATSVAVDAGSGRELCRPAGTPLLLVRHQAYLHTWGREQVDDGQHLAILEPDGGRVLREVQYNPSIATGYDLSDFVWSDRNQRFFMLERLRGYVTGVRALKPDLSLAWYRPDTGPYALCGQVLVSQQYQAYGSMTVAERRAAGLLAQDPATGRPLWARKDLLDAVVGATPTEVVVGGDASLNEQGARYRGLSPEDGREMWAVRLQLLGAKILGNRMIGQEPIVKEYPAGLERIVCYRLR